MHITRIIHLTKYNLISNNPTKYDLILTYAPSIPAFVILLVLRWDNGFFGNQFLAGIQWFHT